jgi:FKBP-type peptidyl-prolyl cis-trans isomerase SlyD
MKVKENSVVSVNFKMTNEKGQVLDSTDDGPLTYLHGHGNIMPALEDAIEDLVAGSSFKVTLLPEEGFGIRDEELTFTVAKTEFDAKDLEIGMQFQTLNDKDEPVIATIIAINEDDVVIDENHPLAGMTLTFEGSVIEIREATQEELSHGHIHAAGGCGHDHGHDDHDHGHHHHHDGCNH